MAPSPPLVKHYFLAVILLEEAALVWFLFVTIRICDIRYWPDGESRHGCSHVGCLSWCRPDLLHVRLSARDPGCVKTLCLR